MAPVYAGEAAGYLLTDPADQDMINGTNLSGVNPNNLQVLPGLGIPLVIQDRTYVDPATIFAQDPTWNWGTGARYTAADAPDPALIGKIKEAVPGDLWYPHVYMTVQNPYDLTGTNAFGRWHYGPWFFPPTPVCGSVPGAVPPYCIEQGPVDNPYFDPACDPAVAGFCQPPESPGTPNPSWGAEAFLDTMTVNGASYPTLTLPSVLLTLHRPAQ